MYVPSEQNLESRRLEGREVKTRLRFYLGIAWLHPTLSEKRLWLFSVNLPFSVQFMEASIIRLKCESPQRKIIFARQRTLELQWGSTDSRDSFWNHFLCGRQEYFHFSTKSECADHVSPTFHHKKGSLGKAALNRGNGTNAHTQKNRHTHKLSDTGTMHPTCNQTFFREL